MSIIDELKSIIGRMNRITAELRDSIADYPFRKARDFEQFYAIADRIDAELAECYVKLPVDADDVPIRIGDEMVFLDLYGNKSEPFVVEGFESPDMWLVHCDEGRVRYTANPMHTRHYHELTAESVLRDFGVDVAHALNADPDMIVPEKIIAKYAAKLMLKEGE